jgi:PAS domain-containing protein
MESQVLMVAIVVVAIGLGFLVALIVGRRWNRIGSLADRAGSLLNRHPLYQVWPQAIVGLDSSGTIRSLNQAAGQLFGCDERDVRGQPISCLIRGAAFRHGARTRGAPSDVLPSSSGIDTEGIRRDGAVFPAHCLPLGRSFILVMDETDRVHLSEVQRRAELLTAAFQMIATPLLIVDRQRRVIVANQACDAVFGSSVREGTHLHELFPGAELGHVNRPRLEHVRSGYVFTAPMDQNGGGHGDLFLFGCRDSAKRRLEDLLTEMTAYSELLLSEIATDSAIREDLERIHAASAEAIAVVRDLVGSKHMAAP